MARSSTARGYCMARALRMSGWIRPRAGRLAPQRPPRCCQRPSKGHSKAAGSPAVMPLLAHGQIQHCARLLHGASSPDEWVDPTTGGPPRSPTTPAMLPAAVKRPIESRTQPRCDAPLGTWPDPALREATAWRGLSFFFFWKAYLSIEGTLNGNRPS